MRKFLALFSIILFGLTSCINDKSVIPEEQTISDLRATLSKLTFEELSDTYPNLPAETKAALWEDKLESILNIQNLNQKQREHLNGLRAQISSDLFISGTRINDKFKNDFAPNWRKHAETLFKFEILRDMVTSLKDVESLEKVLVAYGEPYDKSVCDCSESSDWCGWDPECTGRCNTAIVLCGLFLLYECDGVCMNEGVVTDPTGE